MVPSSAGSAGRVALVSGGAAMIGSAIAAALVRDGFQVVVADVDRQRGAQVAARLGGDASFLPLDLSDDASIATLADALAARHGRLDALINNAVSYGDAGLASDRAAWHRALDVNLVGAALLIGALRPLLAVAARPAASAQPDHASGGARPAGASVVNLGSVGGKVGARQRLLYPSSKAAVLQMTRTLAVDLAADGIRVNAVSPGWTWSDAMQRMSGGDRALADRVGAVAQPLGRVGDPQDVADAVAFLCSPAARFVTGIDLPVDGGFMATGPDQGRGPGHWFAQALQAAQALPTDRQP